jgi:arylformamidase
MLNGSIRALDLSQDFSVHTPAFASYTGPSIKWVKRLAFDRAGGQEITTTPHVGTHLDAPAHFLSGGKFIGDIPLDRLVGPACVVDLERMGIGDYGLYGPEHFEQWERDTSITIEQGDILVIHTGYHKHYPENWADLSEVDETKYFIRHPGADAGFRRVGPGARDQLARRRRLERRPPDEYGHPEGATRRGGESGGKARALARRRLPER